MTILISFSYLNPTFFPAPSKLRLSCCHCRSGSSCNTSGAAAVDATKPPVPHMRWAAQFLRMKEGCTLHQKTWKSHVTIKNHQKIMREPSPNESVRNDEAWFTKWGFHQPKLMIYDDLSKPRRDPRRSSILALVFTLFSTSIHPT